MAMIEYVSGELLQDGKKLRDVELQLTINETMADERSSSVGRLIARHALTTKVPDGRYTLQYFFDGKKEQHQVRIRGGMMLAG